MVAAIGVLTAVTVAGCAPVAAPSPRERIVSIDYCADQMLQGNNEPDLRVSQSEFLADDRQQYIKRCRVPMRDQVSAADQPDILESQQAGE